MELPWIAAELEGSNSETSHGYNESLVGYWKLNRYGSADESNVLDETGHCYDNETEILTLEEVSEEELKELILEIKEIKAESHNPVQTTDTASNLKLENRETFKYKNLSVDDYSDEKNAGVAQSGTAADLRSASNLDLRVRNSCFEPKSDSPSSSVLRVNSSNLDNDKNWEISTCGYGMDSVNEHELSELIKILPECSEAKQGYCKEDNKIHKLTWKYFYELNKTEEVMTLNQETGKKEWQLPIEYQEFDYDKEMYKIELEDGSELLVSEKHKVYSGVKESPKSSIISLFENTSTLDCDLNLGSLDQIVQLSFNASANMGTSLSWTNCLALDSNSLNDSLGITLTNLSNSDNFLLNCSESICAYLRTSDLFAFNSSIAYCGQYNSKFRERDSEMILLTGLSLKNETSMLVSTTNSIFYQPSFLYLFHIPSLILSPISRATRSNSFSESNFCNIFCFQDNLLTLDSTQILTNPDQFTSGKDFICSLTSFGTDKVIEAILPPSYLNTVKTQEHVKVFKSLYSKRP